MKKNIVIGVALMIMSLNNLAAQDSLQVSASISRRFEEAFQGAKNVRWIAVPKKLTLAQFSYLGSLWVAYFEPNGNLLTSGRRIKSTYDLPLKVQNGFLNAKARYEKRMGAFTISYIYEMLRDDMTKYIIVMQNTRVAVTVSVDTSGTAILEKKTNRNTEPAPPKDVIAKKN